ncbi:hypothetical protein Kim5_PA00054 (plasmid) [Rhizobium sp. Kim5]|nr:hypothetical protein Kim5_PA00054 [Rhizobium sp. Kim5]
MPDRVPLRMRSRRPGPPGGSPNCLGAGLRGENALNDCVAWRSGIVFSPSRSFEQQMQRNDDRSEGMPAELDLGLEAYA